MAALGRLAGDMGADFDDLLTVIYQQLEVLGQFANDHPAMSLPIHSAFAEGIQKERLVRRLLAFSGRQKLVPGAVWVNDVVSDVTKKIEQIYGDATEIRTSLKADLRSAWIDAKQLATTLWHLVINAHDAMPDGGRLTIETRNFILDQGPEPASPGLSRHCVCLTITDTGAGMSEAVMSRAFEPFFSTKPVAQGLGLSLVFGFVRQSGGQISLESEPGRGTTVRLYLPAGPIEAPVSAIAREQADSETDSPPAVPTPVVNGTQGPAAARSLIAFNGATKQIGNSGPVRDPSRSVSENGSPPVTWHKAGDTMFGSVPSGVGESRYRLVVEPLLRRNGWDWAVWRPGDTEQTLSHGQCASVLEGMAAAETECERRVELDQRVD